MNYSVFRMNGVCCVTRHNDNGTVNTFSACATELWQEFLEWNAAQPVPFDVSNHEPPKPTARDIAMRQLTETDAGIVRVVEDIWDVLKAKNLVSDSDLPATSWAKLAQRKFWREALK